VYITFSNVSKMSDHLKTIEKRLEELSDHLESIAVSLKRLIDHFAPVPETPSPDAVQLATRMKTMEALLNQLVASNAGDGNGENGELPKKPFLTVAECADATGYAQFTIRQRCNLGTVPGAEKKDRTWRIPREQVERIRSEGLPPID
jgi:hypothetical protein